MDFPTIFDLLDRVGLFRGLPGVVVLLLATFLIVAAWDMRLSLPALLSHYLIAGLLFVDVLDPRLAVVYALAGIFVTAILAITAWQVNWGRPPLGLTAQEAKRLNLPSRRTFGRVSIPNRSLVRLVLAGVVLVLALWLASTPSTLLPVIPDELAYLEPAIAGLMGLGLGQAIRLQWLARENAELRKSLASFAARFDKGTQAIHERLLKVEQGVAQPAEAGPPVAEPDTPAAQAAPELVPDDSDLVWELPADVLAQPTAAAEPAPEPAPAAAAADAWGQEARPETPRRTPPIPPRPREPSLLERGFAAARNWDWRIPVMARTRSGG